MKMDKKFTGEIRKVKDGTLVPEDEWVCFLVKDNAFAAVLPLYLQKCVDLGADEDQVRAVTQLMLRVTEWREQNSSRCKVPDAAGEKLLP